MRWNQLYFCDLPFLNLTLFEGHSEFRRISLLRYLRLKKSVHLSAKEIHTQIRNSMWEFRLPHVLQLFLGTNFLPYQKWFYLTIYALNTPKIPDQIITLRRTSSIVPCRNTSCNILRICFKGSEMTTCLTHDQINDKRKMPILSEETFLESGKVLKKNFQSRNLNTCAASSTQCPNFRGLSTSKVTWHYKWNLKPKRWIDLTTGWARALYFENCAQTNEVLPNSKP